MSFTYIIGLMRLWNIRCLCVLFVDETQVIQEQLPSLVPNIFWENMQYVLSRYSILL